LRDAEVDRLLAAVNGRVITESDLQMARTLNALGDDPSIDCRQQAIDLGVAQTEPRL
jgi:hypothetical protein